MEMTILMTLKLCSVSTLERSLNYLREAAIKLPGKSQDIVSGVLLIEQASKGLSSLKTEVHIEFFNIAIEVQKDQILLWVCHT